MTVAYQIELDYQLAASLPDAARLLAIGPQPESSQVVRLGEIVDRFIEWSRGEVQRGRKKAGTLTAYAKWRRAAARVDLGVLEQDVRRTTGGWCQRVHDAVTMTSGEAQADNVAKLFQAAWTHAEKRGEKLPPNPWKSVERNGSKPPPIQFPEGWNGQLLDVLARAPKDRIMPERVSDIFTVGTTIGARMWCEVTPMKWEDIRERDGLIVFPASKEAPRSVPIELLGERGRAALERQRGRSEIWVWPGRGGKAPIGQTTVNKYWPAFREYAEEQGLMFRTLKGKLLRIHDLRHAFASYATAELHLPKTVVAQLLGHSDQRSTDRYTHFAPHHLRGPAREIAARMGGNNNVVAIAAKPPGLDMDRVALAIRLIGASEKVAEIDENIAARVNQERPEKRGEKGKREEKIQPRAVESWRQKVRKPPDDVVGLLARWLASSIDWTEPLALGWLFGYGADELPAPRRLRVVAAQ